MASPSVVGGLGAGAEALDKANAELAQEIRKKAEIQRRANANMERKGGGGGTVADALSSYDNEDDMAHGQFVRSSAGNGQAVGFRNVDREVAIQRVDAEKAAAEKEAAESLMMLKGAATTVAAALTAVGRAAGVTNSLQETGAMNANQLEATVRGASAKMNLSKSQEDAAVERMRTDGGTGNMTPAQYAAAFLSAGRRKLPAMAGEQVYDVISAGVSGEVTPDEAIGYAGGEVPDVAMTLDRLGSRKNSAASRRVGANVASVASTTTTGDFSSQDRGTRLAKMKAQIRNAKQSSALYSLIGSTDIGTDIAASMMLDSEDGLERENLQAAWQDNHSLWQALTTSMDEQIRQQRDINRNTRPAPPSTDPGK